MRITKETVAIYGVTLETRIQLKLLAVAANKTMAQAVTDLIEDAFSKNKRVSLNRKQRSRFRKIVKRWLPKFVSIKRVLG